MMAMVERKCYSRVMRRETAATESLSYQFVSDGRNDAQAAQDLGR